MRLNARRRTMIAAAAAMLTVFFLGAPLIGSAWTALRSDGSVCQVVFGRTIFCYRDGDSAATSPLPYVVLGITCAGLVAVCWLVGRWVARPLTSVRKAVDRMGPGNLGQRLSGSGPDHDELKCLGDSIDALMDRVAAGYEGQRRFAANASHELRTPLAVQRALVEVAMQAPPEERNLTVLARQLIAENERNVSLVEGLLVLSESDRGLADLAAVGMDTLIHAVVDVHQDLAARHQVTLAVSADPVTVAGDEVLLERMVTNLLQNAIRYNVPGGQVDVMLDATSTLTVANTGTPVPAEAVPRLFEPFRRLASDRTDRSGAGLGLAIVRSIAEAHHGDVTARPGPHGGLVVIVTLPRP